MGHGLEDCQELDPAGKNKVRIDPPFSLALKAESNLVGKESMKLNAFSKTGRNKIALNTEDGNPKEMEEELKAMRVVLSYESNYKEVDKPNLVKKTRWERLEPVQLMAKKEKEYDIRKRKSTEIDMENQCGATDDTEEPEVMDNDDNLQLMRSAAAKWKWMEKVRRSCGVSNGIDIDADGTRGSLSLAWKEDLIVTLRSFSKNHIDAMVKEGNSDAEWRFTGFYGFPYDSNKNDSWNLLRKLEEDKTHPWLVCGDFNEILYSSEKSGGIPRKERKMESFREVLEECQLEDIGYSGAWFTWERGNFAETNIRERLDRGVANERWKIFFQQFEAWWTIEESLEARIKTSWESITGSILEKLENLQGNLKEWENSIKKGKEGLKKKLTKELEVLLAKGVGEFSHLLQGIEKRISSDINASLLSTFTEEVVVSALKEMGPTKAPGPDGFPAIFFQKYCHIVGKDVASFCLGILNNGQNFGHLNSTDIVLIPMTQNPNNLSNFRPISLCSVLYKIVAKAIANRLQGIMENCIDVAQSAFIPGRLIFDNILLAFEMLHTFRKKRMGKKGFMAVKLDMSKAYDRDEWGFIKEVMLKMGFDEKWVDLILKCITTASYAVNINRNMGRTFQATRGLRQGGPLSPFFFLFCSEGLSALMRMALKECGLKGAKASRSGPTITHLLFADDCSYFKMERRLSFHVNNLSDFKVAELIDDSNRKWKEEMLEFIFPDVIVEKILPIPLAKEPDEDVMAWSGEPSREFTIWGLRNGLLGFLGRKKTRDRSMIGAFIHDIHQTQTNIEKCCFEHIPREMNSLAHILATETLKTKREFYLIGDVPEFAMNLKEKEIKENQNDRGYEMEDLRLE
ncbi:reverse transcriptase [Gossypium australe]|uniref:Reverse transcriptase n=1 Tax=Gossypium australe TaxID=47621 RepID=A0A5B6X7R9_9ROSI|nr:reverse transcriptase [Gossypium australe]